LFEYLLAVNNLRYHTIRDYKGYEKVWEKVLLEELGDGVFIGMDDSFLEIHRQELTSDVLTPPLVPKEIKEWITYSYSNENSAPKMPQVRKVETEEGDEEGETFDSDPSRVRLFLSWKDDWEDWAEEIRRMKKVQNLYETFFNIIQTFQKEGEGLELLLGETIITWNHQVGKIKHPLFSTKLDVELDADEGIIYLKPSNQGYRLELNIFSGISLPNMKAIQGISQEARYREVLTDDIDDLASQFVHLVDANGRLSNEEESVELNKEPVVFVNEYVVFLRKKDNHIIKNDLENIIEMMNDDDFDVPSTIQSLVGNPVQFNEQENRKNWGSIGEDLFFPLEANEEQKEIARRLSSNFGVTVQGPPGTGKTHTIANIVSHLLAHGKKILITSQKENPLKVLKEKIPEEIQDLCVPVLGGGRDSLREIEKSIRTISEKLGSLSTEKMGEEIQHLKGELDKSRRREAKFKSELMEYTRSEKTEIEYNGQTVSKADIAKMLSEESLSYDWISDKVSIGAPFPLKPDEFQEMWDLRSELKPAEMYLKLSVFPPAQILKSPSEMKEWLSKGEILKKKYDVAKQIVDKLNPPMDKEYISDLRSSIEAVLLYSNYFKDGTMHYQILDDCVAGDSRKARWVNFLTDVKGSLEEMIQLNNKVNRHEITLPDKPFYEIEADLGIYAERLRQGKKPNLLFGMTKGKQSKYLWETPIVGGKPITTVEEVEILEQYIVLTKKTDEVVRLWNTNLEEVGGASLDKKEKRLFSNIDNHLKEIQKVIQLSNKLSTFQQKTKNLNLPNPEWLQLKFYHNLRDSIIGVLNVMEYLHWEKEYSQYVEQMKSLLAKDNIHKVTQSFIDILVEKRVTEWEEVLNELQYLINRKKKVIRFSELNDKFKSSAPITGRMIDEALGIDLDIPNEYERAWELKSLYDWVTENRDFEAERVEKNIKKEQAYQKKIITQIVANSTWLSQINRITDHQKRALVAWKNYIKRYGKGQGQNAHKYLMEARKEMEAAQGAIPVWIMPVNQVIENFPVSNEKFDVVIFDESSQCDIMSIPVLFRGEKIVVVGDDEQISPYGIGVKDEEIEELIYRYLREVPNARLFDHKISLYEIADQVFPKSGRLMLKEHFRCVPEIIQFSNDLSYGGQMIPLRVPFEHEKLEPPVMAIKVNEGYATEGQTLVNHPEAERIVEDIKVLINDAKYSNQTIGVITLQGTKQAALIENKLRQEIGEREYINRKIICGNAYTLQGDERDVVFLSMVVAKNRRFVAQTKKAQQQTFNVAASRAKNQMRLYHSIDLEDLTNKEDYRYQLLSYCINPTRVNEEFESLEEKCESPFEIDVLRMIVARGYKVRPQVQVGPNRIDFVIEGLRERLAVECDGERWHGPEKWEEDMERQYTLERAGWKFWRVRGREFYFDRVKAMESLWDTLDEMGIEKNTEVIEVS
jgi:very-short-patch-repair endonuclease